MLDQLADGLAVAVYVIEQLVGGAPPGIETAFKRANVHVAELREGSRGKPKPP